MGNLIFKFFAIALSKIWGILIAKIWGNLTSAYIYLISYIIIMVLVGLWIIIDPFYAFLNKYPTLIQFVAS